MLALVNTPSGAAPVELREVEEPEPTLFDFFGHEMAKVQTFHSYASSGEEGFGEDLALLASLVASGDLTPQVGAKWSWRDLAETAGALRDRRVNGKAVFRVD